MGIVGSLREEAEKLEQVLQQGVLGRPWHSAVRAQDQGDQIGLLDQREVMFFNLVHQLARNVLNAAVGKADQVGCFNQVLVLVGHGPDRRLIQIDGESPLDVGGSHHAEGQPRGEPLHLKEQLVVDSLLPRGQVPQGARFREQSTDLLDGYAGGPEVGEGRTEQGVFDLPKDR
ncbi:hypothetical protein DYH09_32270 [bacterium CPR1]|nr:hypothetical protein [bacterium CPR1]